MLCLFYFLLPTISALNSKHCTDTRTMVSSTMGELLIMFAV